MITLICMWCFALNAKTCASSVQTFGGNFHCGFIRELMLQELAARFLHSERRKNTFSSSAREFLIYFWPQRPPVGTRRPKNFLRKKIFGLSGRGSGRESQKIFNEIIFLQKKNLKKIFLRKKKHKNFFDLLGRRTGDSAWAWWSA